MITILAIFSYFRQKIGVFLKDQCHDHFCMHIQKAVIRVRQNIYPIFWRKYFLKFVTSTPRSRTFRPFALPRGFRRFRSPAQRPPIKRDPDLNPGPETDLEMDPEMGPEKARENPNRRRRLKTYQNS
jgi:hypothetical protein